MVEKNQETPITRIEFNDLSTYELVLLLARRAREINQRRIELENELKTKLIEEVKPIEQAIEELLSGKLRYKRGKKEVPPPPPSVGTKGPATII